MIQRMGSIALALLLCAVCAGCGIPSLPVSMNGETLTREYRPAETADGPYHIVIEDLILTGNASVTVIPADEAYAVVSAPEGLFDYGFAVAFDGDTVSVGTDRSDTVFRCKDFALTIYADYDSITCSGGFQLDADASGIDRLTLTVNGAVQGAVHDLDASYGDFAVSGAADLEIDGDIDDFSLTLSGAGKLVIRGASDTFHAVINGAGRIDGSAFTAREADLEIRGVGSGVIGVSDTLNASVAGEGTIRYYGNPAQVHTSIAGAGSILPAE